RLAGLGLVARDVEIDLPLPGPAARGLRTLDPARRPGMQLGLLAGDLDRAGREVVAVPDPGPAQRDAIARRRPDVGRNRGFLAFDVEAAARVRLRHEVG